MLKSKENNVEATMAIPKHFQIATFSENHSNSGSNVKV